MASVGLLLLLLLMSSINISTETDHKEILKTAVRAVKRNKAGIGPFIRVIPTVGPAADAIFNLATTGLNDNPNAALITEFEKVHLKLDQYQIEQKCSSWKSGLYYKPKRDIDLGWDAFKVLLASLQEAKDDKDKQKHKDEFNNIYSQYETATNKLRNLLKDKGNIFKCNDDDVAEYLKCHEKEIIEFTGFINKLISKGNMMNKCYYKLKSIESAARTDALNNIAYDVASAMFEMHKRCIIHSMTYVERDVRPFIDTSKTRDDLAKEVWSFLDETYDRYDWMVVAFISKNSKFKHWKALNKHVLSGFTNVSTEGVTVAVARQVKGTHTKAETVSKAIKSCVPETVLCYNVAQTLSKCEENVEGIPVNQTYTAVHAYTRKGHQNFHAKEANPDAKASPNAEANPEDEDEDEVNAAPENPSVQTPYIYTGKCKKNIVARLPVVREILEDGNFVVLIKSDEEVMGKNPCSNLDCGEKKGSCVPMNDIFLAMCQCNYPYYGQHCENDINNYRTQLEEEAGTHAERYRKVKVKTD